MVDLCWAKASFLNFGDDLNLWLWPRLFPNFFARQSNDSLVGIGTILGNRLPRSGRLFIMGSGAGYAPLPPPGERAHWSPIFVRGPLTARVLGLSPDAAITDGAFLAARYVRSPATPARGTIFIPHWKSELMGDWPDVCAYAGLRHVSPMQPVDTVIDAILTAELVVTESMHGAILADALRVPWVAARTSPDINDFKWIDWCLTIGVRHDPHYIPPTGNYDLYRQNKARASVGEEAFAADPDADEEQLAQSFLHRFPVGTGAGAPSRTSRRSAQVARTLRTARDSMIRWGMRQALMKPSVLMRDLALKERAAIALASTATRMPKLSEDAVHARLMNRLDEAVDRFRAAVAE